MRKGLNILFLFLIYNTLVLSQISSISLQDDILDQYMDPSQSLLLNIELSADVEENELESYYNGLNLKLILKEISTLRFQEINAIYKELPLSFLKLHDQKARFQIVLPAGSVEPARYSLDIELRDVDEGTKFYLSNFAENSPTLTVGECGIVNGIFHFYIGSGFSSDYALIGNESSIADLPTNLEGIYSNGFCKDELVSLRDLKIQAWHHEGFEDPSAFLNYKIDLNDWKRVELNKIPDPQSFEALSKYFPSSKKVYSNGITDLLFELPEWIDDLLYEVEQVEGSYELSFNIEITSGKKAKRFPKDLDFTSSFEIVDAPIGADCQAALLPIELLDFLVVNKEDKVYLKWISAIEINNQAYFVERSSDAFEWKVLHEVHGQGNSNDYQQYTYQDNLPLPGISYYRLRQMDFDGSMSFSKVKRVHIRSSNISLFPNPVSDYIYYNIEDPDQKYYIKMYDQTGSCVYSVTIPDPNSAFHRMNVTYLPSGVYVLKYINASNYLSRTSKYIKL